jgi:hypothetical protein
MKKLSELPVLSRRRRIEVLLETYRDVLEEDGPLPVLGGRPKVMPLAPPWAFGRT